jgi:hypothetical protein
VLVIDGKNNQHLMTHELGNLKEELQELAKRRSRPLDRGIF